MPPKIAWTQPRDTCLRRLRAEGATWNTIAAELAVSRNAAIERGRKIGARRPPHQPAPPQEDPHRPPLPAGHPRSWAEITAGTLLAGTAYPDPLAPAEPLSIAE